MTLYKCIRPYIRMQEPRLKAGHIHNDNHVYIYIYMREYRFIATLFIWLIS